MMMKKMIITMATRENEFEPRLGKPAADHAPRRLKVVRAAVKHATRRPRVSGPKPKQPGIRAHFVKGSASCNRPVSVSSRRVVVKVRYVTNGGGRAAPLRAHLAYLAREGASRMTSREVTPEEEGQAQDPTRTIDYLAREAGAWEGQFAFFDRENSTVDPRAITAGWADDPRHFRMIVSPEDGEALGDLKPFIRELMARLETKLGTKLDWLAVNHHDTDNPHTHVLIRGRRPDGQELFIPSRLIASGIREQAQEIVTRVLGPRLGVDLERERFNDISLKAVTPLDRELLAMVRNGRFLPDRPDLAARLERLESWGLAARLHGGWRLDADLTTRLREIAAHDEVERAVATVRRGREPQLLLEAHGSQPVVGELVHLGPADDLGDRFLAVIETGAGELRYAHFERAQDLAILDGVQSGALVTIAPNTAAIRPSDEAVARVARQTGGVYSAEVHVELEPFVDRRILVANIRRLEHMRRMGLVERSARGEFTVGGDHLGTAMAFEQRLVRRAPFSVHITSYWSLGEQIDALGPTHLDRVLAGEEAPVAGESPFARRHAAALQQRRLFLIEQGWMGTHQPVLSQQALQRMAQMELSAQAKSLSEELAVPVLTYTVHRVAGVYARRIDLVQGRIALILGERQANLVSWRPALEQFAGRHVEGVMRGQGLSWSVSQGMALGIA